MYMHTYIHVHVQYMCTSACIDLHCVNVNIRTCMYIHVPYRILIMYYVLQ